MGLGIVGKALGFLKVTGRNESREPGRSLAAAKLKDTRPEIQISLARPTIGSARLQSLMGWAKPSTAVAAHHQPLYEEVAADGFSEKYVGAGTANPLIHGFTEAELAKARETYAKEKAKTEASQKDDEERKCLNQEFRTTLEALEQLDLAAALMYSFGPIRPIYVDEPLSELREKVARIKGQLRERQAVEVIKMLADEPAYVQVTGELVDAAPPTAVPTAVTPAASQPLLSSIEPWRNRLGSDS